VNAAETIAAAIEKLEAKRDAATPGSWLLQGETVYGSLRDSEDGPIRPWIAEADEPNADLIVTLHRTIEPLLNHLRQAALGYAGMTPMPTENGHDGREVVYGFELYLARVILGEVSS
jgi:hypothetical protein